MTLSQPILVVIPLRDMVNRIILNHVMDSNAFEVKDVMELLIVMWLRDRHFAIHGEYLGSDRIQPVTLRERIKLEVIDALVIDPLYLEEPTLLNSVINDVAVLLFQQLETLLPMECLNTDELPNVRVARWLASDVVLELFE